MKSFVDSEQIPLYYAQFSIPDVLNPCSSIRFDNNRASVLPLPIPACYRLSIWMPVRHVSTPQISPDRKSVVWGKSVSVRVDLGCRRVLKKTNIKIYNHTLVYNTSHKNINTV